MESRILDDDSGFYPIGEVFTDDTFNVDSDLTKVKLPTKSQNIIELEIKQLQAREEQLRKEGALKPKSKENRLKNEMVNKRTDEEYSVSSVELGIHSEDDDSVYDRTPPECYFDNSSTETRIAMEIREMRDREMELQAMRENLTDEGHCSEYSEEKDSNHSEENSRLTSPDLPESISSCSTNSVETSSNGIMSYSDFYSRRRVTVRPLADTDETPTYRPANETPVEREIRIVRERENELRKQRGLPIIEAEKQMQRSISHDSSVPNLQNSNTQHNQTTAYRRPSLQPVTASTNHTPRRFSTSSVLPMTTQTRPATYNSKKFTPSVSSKGLMQKFIASQGKMSMPAPVTTTEQKVPAFRPKIEIPLDTAPAPKVKSTVVRRQVQTADQKIQMELREMRKREEELRQQRTWMNKSQPNLSSLVDGHYNGFTERSTSSCNLLDDDNESIMSDASQVSAGGTRTSRRRSTMIDKWETIISQNTDI